MTIIRMTAAVAALAVLSACGGEAEQSEAAEQTTLEPAAEVDASATEMNMGGVGTDTNETTTGAGTGSTAIGGTAGTGVTGTEGAGGDGDAL